MTSWEEERGPGGVVPGVPVEQTGQELALLCRPSEVAEIAVGHVFRDGHVDYFAGEAMDLGDAQVSAAQLYLGGMATQVIVDRRRAEQAAGPQPVEISLEAARRDPESILDMIRSAPLSDFHERVIRADKRGFKERFQRYISEGKPRLWTSLELSVPGETSANRRLNGTRPGRSKRDNRQVIADFQKEDRAPLNSNNYDSLIKGGWLYGQVRDYILVLDERFELGQEDVITSDGLAPITPNPSTQERLDRLNAVRYPHAAAEGGPRQRHHGADMLKLEGLGHKIKRLWARHHKDTMLRDLDASHEDIPEADLPDDLLNAEALYVALSAEFRLKTHGPKAVISEMASTINSMEEIRGGLEESEDASSDEGLFRLDLGAYGERAFRRAIQVAGASWQVMSQLDPGNLKVFEAELLGEVINELDGRGLLGEPQDRSGLAAGRLAALPAAVRAAMRSEHFREVAAGSLAQMTASEVAGTASGSLVEQFLRAVGDAAARDRDEGGRYREVWARQLRDATLERGAEDFPGQGRLFTFYGSFWTEDGRMGALEAMAARSGAYEHIDSAGNSPLREGAVRVQLERLATEELHYPLQVHEPFVTIPRGYKCETAHFVGLLPRLFRARNVLSVLIPNGFATVSEHDNPGLAEEIKRSGAQLRYKSIPTDLLRFLRSPADGSLRYNVGHKDPELQSELQGQEVTLAIFMDKPDGTPSDLFQVLYPEEAATIMEAMRPR